MISSRYIPILLTEVHRVFCEVRAESCSIIFFYFSSHWVNYAKSNGAFLINIKDTPEATACIYFNQSDSTSHRQLPINIPLAASSHT